MPVAIPERTVDSWVSVYVAQRVPEILLWAPTQRQIPDYDLAAGLPGRGKLFVLENKAPYANGSFGFDLSLRQMWNYLRNPTLRDRTYYVLPRPPFPTTAVPPPSLAGASLLPDRATTRLPGHAWAPPGACENWFFVVAVLDLWTALVATVPPALGSAPWPTRGPRPPGAPPHNSVWLECPLGLSQSITLREFMDRVLACEFSHLWVDPEDYEQRAHEADDGRDSPLLQALVTFVPAGRMPG